MLKWRKNKPTQQLLGELRKVKGKHGLNNPRWRASQRNKRASVLKKLLRVRKRSEDRVLEGEAQQHSSECDREHLEQAARHAAEQAARAVLSGSPSPLIDVASGGCNPSGSGFSMQFRGTMADQRGRQALTVTIDTLPKFSASDPAQTVQKWIARVNEDAIINGWDDFEKFLAAKRALTGAAKRWHDSQEGISSWALLQKGLLPTFGQQIKSSDIHEICEIGGAKRENQSLSSYTKWNT